MNQELDKIRLFERIREQAKWTLISPSLKEDLVHEAWLLACEYAEKNNRPLDTLSNTELKYRCLEASRKLRLAESLSLEDFEDDIPDSQIPDPLEQLARAEDLKINSQKIDKIEWILREHPKLRLSPAQGKIFEELKNKTLTTNDRWRANYARALGVTRQNIWNTERRVRQKIIYTSDLLELLEGKILWFYSKYGKTWSGSEEAMIVKPVANQDWKTTQIHIYFETLQEDMLTAACEILVAQLKREIDPEQLLIGYNIMRRGAWINREKAHQWLQKFRSEIPHDNWILQRFLDGWLGNTSEDELFKYNERLKYLLRNDSWESRWYAGASISRWGAATDGEIKRYLKCSGRTAVNVYDLEHAIKEVYKIIQEELWLGQSKAFFNRNFLNLLNVLRYYRTSLSAKSKNTLRTICQMSHRYSSDNFVVSEAEKLLSTVES